MRRVATLLLICVTGMPSLSTAAPGRADRRTAAADLLSIPAAGRKATARLVQDAGLLLTTAELPGQVLRAVLVDIDADGDADLVANLGTLDLGVWINDGSGRLTRAQTPAPPAALGPQPPAPSLVPGSPHLEITVPDGRSSFAPMPVRAGPAPSAPSRLAKQIDIPAVSALTPDPSSPRAPPLA